MYRIHVIGVLISNEYRIRLRLRGCRVEIRDGVAPISISIKATTKRTLGERRLSLGLDCVMFGLGID